ncbi:hypothetical protein VTJ04DRAFT_6391 [Mycothermus thermophilus]|uniref:uncharacterized protein n=1 Tax=Humicola insolens TaxID=85995 RepID=UPI003744553D
MCPEAQTQVDREREIWIGDERVDLLHYATYSWTHNNTQVTQAVRSCLELKAQGNLAEALQSDKDALIERFQKDLDKCSVNSSCGDCGSFHALVDNSGTTSGNISNYSSSCESTSEPAYGFDLEPRNIYNSEPVTLHDWALEEQEKGRNS